MWRANKVHIADRNIAKLFSQFIIMWRLATPMWSDDFSAKGDKVSCSDTILKTESQFHEKRW